MQKNFTLTTKSQPLLTLANFWPNNNNTNTKRYELPKLKQQLNYLKNV